jgi:hypothetical protein
MVILLLISLNVHVSKVNVLAISDKQLFFLVYDVLYVFLEAA